MGKKPDSPAERAGPLTVYELALELGAEEIDGRIDGAEFARLGLPVFAGCGRCGASLAAFNAFPSSTGFIRCGDCIDGLGFATVEEFRRYSDGD